MTRPLDSQLDGLSATFNSRQPRPQRTVIDRAVGTRWRKMEGDFRGSGLRSGFETDALTSRAMQAFLLGLPWRG